MVGIAVACALGGAAVYGAAAAVPPTGKDDAARRGPAWAGSTSLALLASSTDPAAPVSGSLRPRRQPLVLRAECVGDGILIVDVDGLPWLSVHCAGDLLSSRSRSLRRPSAAPGDTIDIRARAAHPSPDMTWRVSVDYLYPPALYPPRR